MPRSFVVLAWLALFTVDAPPRAIAGAFMLAEGTGQFIAGVGYAEGSRRFDPSGQAVEAPGYSKAIASGYLEYGLTPFVTLVLAPTLAHQTEVGTNTVTGSDASAFGARLLLYGSERTVAAVQVLVEPGRPDAAVDARLTLGQAFAVDAMTGFVDLEPGVRLRAEWPNEARLDATVGLRPTERLLCLLQEFGSLAHSNGLVPYQSYSKVQASAVYDLSSRWSIQAGAFRTVVGRNAIRDMGPIGGVWYRF